MTAAVPAGDPGALPVSDVDGLRAAVVQTLGMVGEDCDPPLTWRDKDFIQAALLPVVTAWAEERGICTCDEGAK